METKRSKDTIQSLKTGLSIIEAIVAENRPLRIIEIQEKTQITKSNLYKYMNTLVNENLIFREQETGMYHLGSRLIQYGMAAIGNQDVIAITAPYLQKICSETNHSVIFALPTFDGPVIAKIFRPHQTLNIGAEIGTLLPPNSSAGKIFDVFSTKLMVENWRRKYNFSNDETSVESEEIKTEKIAFATEPLIAEISSVAIPIISFNNELVGIVTLVGFSSEIPGSIDSPISLYLKQMQLEISERF
ncbi:IclR family transcriptional regulator [Oceanobacillus saliphilus]|uniref:IclR family transcriptional regulator n=1 Tax=Oceanobacillus saliphilus TaxID=2925834 RepID=UPI00201E271D|nr:helix-turn-helix domain-containing protein [Oceanobacillus saliphilus]